MPTTDVVSNDVISDRLGLLHPKQAIKEANARKRKVLEQLIAVYGKEHPLVAQLETSIAAFELVVQDQT